MKKSKPQKSKKTSGVKQRNRLRNKGKIKVKRHVHKNIFMFDSKKAGPSPMAIVPEVEASDVLDMIENDDIRFLKKSVTNQSYNLLKQIRVKERPERYKKMKEKEDDDEDMLETEYGKSHRSSDHVKMLLPVKTKHGIMRRYCDIEDEDEIENDDENKLKDTQSNENASKKLTDSEEVTWLETTATSGDLCDINQPVSIAKLFAVREDMIRKYKLRIGLLSSSLLENPELKIGNLKYLLEIMGKKDLEPQITVKKLATLSLMEVFKDLLPGYQIKHQDVPRNKLKKTTKQLIGYESQLLSGYKMFLTKLEKMASSLRKKKGDTRVVSTQLKGLGELAVRCLCELLSEHPYFNYSANIVQLLTLYLDNPDPDIRKIVEECYKKVFREDKKGFITLVIVRRINYLVKTRAHSVHCEALSVLLSLRIKNVNLDQEKEEEIKNKQLLAKKKKILSMSKRERKRKKQLDKLENEMLEAKAEESKKSKEYHLTEITKLVFLIYFRILKRAPKSNLLSITLEGLAKFAHCINLEYYQDLMNVLDNILENEPLNTREQLYCIKTVFIILSGYGESLNIDPAHFYTHLYKTLLTLNAGKYSDNASILLSTLDAVLIHKHKKVTMQRMLSFTKRLATVSLQMLHNGTLGALAIIKSVIQVTKTADLLLDVESSYGQGIYSPEMDEPEYANAANSALWELCALQRHYHPTVRVIATHIAGGAPTIGEGTLSTDISKMSAVQFYEQYDPCNGAFKPAIQPPSKKLSSNKIKHYRNLNNNRVSSLYNILNNVQCCENFSSIIIK